jgi:hypothetical protein
MQPIVSLLKEIVLGMKKDNVTADNASITFLKTPKSILAEINYSKKSQNVLGIYSAVLGEGMFLTSV